MSDLTFRTYSGMSVPLVENDDHNSTRLEAARYIFRARQRGHSVVTLTPGNAWEIQTEANLEGRAITDEDGVLRLTDPAPVESEDQEEWL